MSGGPREQESAIEYEIRLAREREEMLLREKEERKQLTEKQPIGQGQTIIASYEAVSSESEAYQPAYHELAEADRGADLWPGQGRNGIKGDFQKVELEESGEGNANESIIEREIRLERQREAELQRQRQLATPRSQPTETDPISPMDQLSVAESDDNLQSSSSDLVPADVNHSEEDDIAYEDAISGVQHSGESLIAREMREMKEREEEIMRMRQTLPNANVPDNEVTVEPVIVTKANSNNVAASPSPQQNVEGTWQKDVSPFVSQKRRESADSSSNHSGAGAAPSSRTIKVQPLADSKDSDDDREEKPNYCKKQESPIERELRMARERENELRRIKGLPEIVESKEERFSASYGGISSPSQEAPPPRNTWKQKKNDSLKQYSSNQLQKEVNAQREKEMALRKEGKVISSSDDDHIKPFKYLEVTGTSRADGSQKRNFATKQTAAKQNPPPVQNGQTTPRDLPSPSASTAVTQSSKKGPTSGGHLFSYKEVKQTAESKIEKELREMREREEELKRLRSSNKAETPS